MALARIRTSDPEVVEFLSRHLAASGYHLEFVRPGEPVEGEADLEIDASRMDLASAMAQAQQEPGLITILQGVLRAEPEAQQAKTQQPARDFREYADVSPYARGAELEDEPSKLQQAAQATGNALAIGWNSLGEVTKATSSRFGAWKAQRDAARAARRERREREMAVAAARRREEGARKAEEESQRRAEEERLAAIRREEMARMQAVEQRRREEELAAIGIERQRQEELRLAEQRQQEVEEQRHREEDWRLQQESEEFQRAAAASREEPVAKAEAATGEDVIAEPRWEQAEEPRVEPKVPAEPKLRESNPRPAFAPVARKRPSPTRRISRQRERTFKRAGTAAAIVAAGVISVWSLAALRRPANPLNTEQLRNSAVVQQHRPFGPATAAAPVVRPPGRPAAATKKPVSRKPAVRARSSRTRTTKSSTAKNNSDDTEPEVVVRHFATPKPPQPTATVEVKDGVKIISEN